MKFIIALIAALAICILPASASDKDKDNKTCHYNHICDNKCHGNDHHNHHCDSRCYNVVTVTNIVNVTRTNVITVQVPTPVYFNVTNYFNETVTNYVTAALDDASANYTLQEGHLYRFYVASKGRFTSWGRIASASNQVVRVSVPGALYTAEPLVWQVVDVTKGFPTVAVTAEEPIVTPNNAYVAVNRRLYRVVR